MGEPVARKILFVTNYCPHYRVKTFEMLARECGARFCFYSTGSEPYWLREHGVRTGNFPHEYLRGVRVGGVWFVPSLAQRLLTAPVDAFIKCINDRFALPLTYLAARTRRRPFILWTGIWMRFQSPAHRAGWPLTRWIYRNADAVVGYGEHVRRFLVGEGVDPARIFVGRHAVDNEACGRKVSDEEKRQVRARLRVGAADRLVLYVGRFDAAKGVDDLLAAFARVEGEGRVLVLAGAGPEEATVRKRVQELGIGERVRFAGYVPPEETATFYAAAEVAVVPSVTTATFREPWGLVVNEAFNQGAPVIATDAVGAAAGGLVREGENGLVVPERDADALAAALRRVLEEPGLAARLGAEARRTIANWGNPEMVAGFRSAIESVCR